MGDIKYVPKKIFIVSLDYGDSGNDTICENADAVSEALSEFTKAAKESNKSAAITISKCKVSDELHSDLYLDEFIRMYFDNVEWVIDGVTEMEKICIEV